MTYQAINASRVLKAAVFIFTISVKDCPKERAMLNACTILSSIICGCIGFATGYISLKFNLAPVLHCQYVLKVQNVSIKYLYDAQN